MPCSWRSGAGSDPEHAPPTTIPTPCYMICRGVSKSGTVVTCVLWSRRPARTPPSSVPCRRPIDSTVNVSRQPPMPPFLKWFNPMFAFLIGTHGIDRRMSYRPHHDFIRDLQI